MIFREIYKQGISQSKMLVLRKNESSLNENHPQGNQKPMYHTKTLKLGKKGSTVACHYATQATRKINGDIGHFAN